MTVKKKKATTPKFMGIVVAGASFAEAQNRYRETALSESAVALKSASGQVFATHENCVAGDFFNSLSGNLDLVETNLQLQSNSSANDEVEAFVTVCSDGCGDVIIADNADVVEFCPSCSSEVPEHTEDEVEALLAESEDEDSGEYPEGDQGIIVSASSFEEAHERFHEVATQGQGVSVVDNAQVEMGLSNSSGNVTFVTHPDCDYQHSPYFGSESLDAGEEIQVDDEFTSESAGNDGIEAHYLLCQSNTCTDRHIIASKDECVFCPSCSSAVVDPALLAELQESDSNVEDDFDFDAYESQSGIDDSDEAFDEGEYEDDEDFEEEDDFEDFDDSDEAFDEGEYEDDFEEDDFESDSGDNEDEEDDFEDDDFEDEDFGDEDDFESDSGDNEDEDGDESDDDLGLELSEEDEEDEEDEMESESMELEVNLLQAISASNQGQLDPEKLYVANCGAVDGVGTWTAFYGNMPIALARANEVPANVQKIFDQPAFRAAVSTSAKTDGVEQALSAMGFKAIVPDINMQCVVESSIMEQAQAQVDEMANTVKQRETELVDRLHAALSTSFAGINRNFFKGISNPLRSSLIGSLSAAGLKNPESIVDHCLSQSSDDLSRIAIDKAFEIVGRSPEAQNELAEAVASANIGGGSSSDLNTIGSPVNTVEQQDQDTVQGQSLSSESSAPRTNRLKNLLAR